MSPSWHLLPSAYGGQLRFGRLHFTGKAHHDPTYKLDSCGAVGVRSRRSQLGKWLAFAGSGSFTETGNQEGPYAECESRVGEGNVHVVLRVVPRGNGRGQWPGGGRTQNATGEFDNAGKAEWRQVSRRQSTAGD